VIRSNRQLRQLLRLDLDFLDHPKAKFRDVGQQVAHFVPRRRRYVQPDEVSQMIKDYQAGSTLKELGARFGSPDPRSLKS
jgi:hypothetical protein